MEKGMKTTVWLLLLLAGLAGRAELLSCASSRPVSLDLTGTATTAVKVGETFSVECSPLFVKGDCETLRLNEIENGVTNRLTELDEAGVFNWKPESIGVQTLELTFLKSGEAIGTRRIGLVEVWNDRVVLERGDIPLCELMPTKYRDVTQVTIETAVANLAENLFAGCSSLRSVELNSAFVVRSTTLRNLFPAAYAQLTNIVLGEDVTAVPDGFFDGCTALTDFSFTASVEDFGDNDFRGIGRNRGLRGLWIENGWVLGYLGECPGMVAIPAGVKGVASHAFEEQKTLVSVQFPDSLASIGAKAFKTCTGLERLTVPESVTWIGDGAFQDCTWMQSLDLPEGLARIGDFAFANCSTLERLVCPEGLAEIGVAAFSNCWRMLSVSIPASVDAIGDGAFTACSRLTGATVPTHVRPVSEILPDAYRQLESISIAAGETVLVPGAFANCSGLTHIDLPQGLGELPSMAFMNCSKLTSLKLPEGVRAIGSNAFRGTAFTSIEFPSTLETIGDYAFYRLKGLSELVLPPSLRSIGGFSFAGCSGLMSLVVPARVTSLGDSFIRDCSSLESVYFLGSAPSVVAETYVGTPDALVSYVIKGSTGWDGVATSKALPQSWPTSNGRAIAYWEPNVFDVTFLGNGGEPAERTVSETTGTTYMLPTEDPVRTGAHFAGWWTEPENGGEVRATTKVELTHAHSLYAHWNFFGYTVAFDLDGADGSLPSLPMSYGTAKRLPACPVRRVNFDFAGWSLTRGSAVAFADGAEVLNLTAEEGATVTLYAVWRARAWTASDYLDAAKLEFSSAGDAAWVSDPSVSHDGLGSMRSGAIGAAPEGTTVRSVLKTAVKGNGFLTFWWKVNCESADAESGDLYDYLELTVDGERPEAVKPIAGDVDWVKVSVRIEGDSFEHEVAWSFVKDDYDEEILPDVAWVDEIDWTPDVVEVTFDGNGATGGEAPAAIRTYAGETVILPDLGELVNEGFKFVGWTDGIRTYAAGEAYLVGVGGASLAAVWKSFSLGDVVNAPELSLTTGGDAEWAEDPSESRDGVSSLRSGAVAVGQESWLEATLLGAGTLTFWWKSDGLDYRGKPANYVQYQVDGGEAVRVAETDWSQVSVSIIGTGEHTVRWTYRHTRTQTTGSNCAWLDEVAWASSGTSGPSVSGDPDATVTGDAENGFTVRPGAANAEVVVEIPDGVDVAKVTVEVSPDVRTVTPNGAALRVVRGDADITDYLDIPAAVGGVIDLSAATVKAEYANEPLDAAKGAKIDLSSAESPSLTTAPTRKGLTYRLKEGETLPEMESDADGDQTIGDGAAWSPKLTVKGGSSGFYTIKVEK